MDILQTLLDLFAEYGYWVVFFGVMLENAGLPIPGETILLAAGFASALGIFHLPVVILIAAAGAVIGDNIGYWIGHHYGRTLLEKVGPFTLVGLQQMDAFHASHATTSVFIVWVVTFPLIIFIFASGGYAIDTAFWAWKHFGRGYFGNYGAVIVLTPQRLERMDIFFHRHGAKTIFVARFITGLRVFAALFAGATRMRWRIFFLYNVGGAILWAIVISMVGRVFGNSWPILERWIGRSGLAMLVLLVIIGVVTWWLNAHQGPQSDGNSV
jgi:membrane protein DedA with SNARE-associated domain